MPPTAESVCGLPFCCAAISEAVSLTSAVVSTLFSRQLVSIFIREPVTVGYGAAFLRILCLAIPIYSLTFIIIAVFQAMGCGRQPFLLSILHKGSLDIVLLFVIRSIAGTEHVLWAAMISETVALLAGIGMLIRYNLRNEEKALQRTK